MSKGKGKIEREIPCAIIDPVRRLIYAGASHTTRGAADNLLDGAIASQHLNCTKLNCWDCNFHWCKTGWNSEQLMNTICVNNRVAVGLLGEWSVVLWVGTNDLTQAGVHAPDIDTAADKYSKNVHTILDHLLNFLKVKAVYLVTPNAWSKPHVFTAHRLLRDYLIHESNNCPTLVKLVDLFKGTTYRQQGSQHVKDGCIQKTMGYKENQRPDGKHLTKEGYEVFINLLKTAISK
jgi:hypothetical protein